MVKDAEIEVDSTDGHVFGAQRFPFQLLSRSNKCSISSLHELTAIEYRNVGRFVYSRE